jgi:hypothetical protein
LINNRVILFAYTTTALLISLNREKEALNNTADKIKTYETMFDQLKKMTGTDRLEEVSGRLADFQNHEIFSIFSIVSPL